MNFYLDSNTLSVITQTIVGALATLTAVTVYRLERLAKKYESTWKDDRECLEQDMKFLTDDKNKDYNYTEADTFSSAWKNWDKKLKSNCNIFHKKYERTKKKADYIERYIRWRKAIMWFFRFFLGFCLFSVFFTILAMKNETVFNAHQIWFYVLYAISFIVGLLLLFCLFSDSFIFKKRSNVMCNESNIQQKKDEKEYLILAYQSVLEDLRFFKKQQWYIAYYFMAICYGIIWLWSGKYFTSKCLLYIVEIFNTVTATLLILQFHYSIKSVRKRKQSIQERISSDFKDILFGDPPHKIRDLFDKWSVTILLILVILLGGFITSLILYKG